MTGDITTRDSALDAALDQALARGLQPPSLPTGFRTRLMAAVAREGAPSAPVTRMALAAEHERRLAELRQGYLRLQRRTLLLMLVVAFGVGLLAATLLPDLRARFGDIGLLAVLMGGAVAGVAVGATSWWRSSPMQRYLD